MRRRAASGSCAQRPRKAILSEFGLSLHVESQRGGEVRNVTIDFGFTPEARLNNMEPKNRRHG
jgi:7,8-dihydropterin-6-yl-methyl-4-(beta-D-ribofuranosyl)aminobenzene 5'-phosphate synthase